MECFGGRKRQHGEKPKKGKGEGFGRGGEETETTFSVWDW
jgi:hypothetical protein